MACAGGSSVSKVSEGIAHVLTPVQWAMRPASQAMPGHVHTAAMDMPAAFAHTAAAGRLAANQTGSFGSGGSGGANQVRHLRRA